MVWRGVAWRYAVRCGAVRCGSLKPVTVSRQFALLGTAQLCIALGTAVVINVLVTVFHNQQDVKTGGYDAWEQIIVLVLGWVMLLLTTFNCGVWLYLKVAAARSTVPVRQDSNPSPKWI